MTLKYYILKSFMVLSLFITGMFVAGNVDPLHATEAAAPEAVDITPAIEWIDSDDFAFCQPGESGRFEVKFMEMYGIQPEGTIEFFSGAPDYLEVTPDGKWTAKKEGQIPVGYTCTYSKETLEAFRKKFPGADLQSREEPSSILVSVSPICSVFRLYNPNSGEHVFTTDRNERKVLAALGWKAEQIAWNTRAENSTPVRRLYNPNTSDHHYTMDEREVQYLTSVGWNLDQTVLFSGGEKDVPVYRCYNPNATTGTHHFTTNETEYNYLVEAGWKPEGIAFYGTSSDRVSTLNPAEPKPADHD